MKIVAFTGKMGSGKTEATEILLSLHKGTHKRIKFAQPLYDMQKFIYERCQMPLQGKDRKLLQWLGTEWGREKDEDLWVNTWANAVEQYRYEYSGQLVVVDDLRFENEAYRVDVMGGYIFEVCTSPSIRALRIPVMGEAHASEAGIDHKFIERVIWNNGSRSELEQEVRTIVEDYL